MPLVLSTKILDASLKRHLFAANIDLVEYNAIQIKALKSDIKDKYFQNTIFTSQNAIKIALNQNIKIDQVFCVGGKTEALLKQNRLNVISKADNARDLADIILEKYADKSFDFFCSKQRRNDLPDLLKENHIQLKEHHLYDSVCNFKIFPNDFDAVLCFSPLGVKSFYSVHKSPPLAICIGTTTAEAAKQYTKNVILSSQTSVESVVIKAIKTFSIKNI